MKFTTKCCGVDLEIRPPKTSAPGVVIETDSFIERLTSVEARRVAKALLKFAGPVKKKGGK